MMAAGWFLTAVAGLCLASLFSTLHLTLRHAARVRLEELAGDLPAKSRRRIHDIVEHMEGHALAVAFPRVLFTYLFMISVVAWTAVIRHQGDPTAMDVAIGVAISSLLAWAFAVALPVSVAEHAAEPTVVQFNRLIRVAYGALAPLRGVGGLIDVTVKRLAGNEEEEPVEALQAEVLSVVEEGEREGQIGEAAKEMIGSVMELSLRTVEQIMTPRTEIEALEYTDDLSKVTAFVRETGHSRVPVYREQLDHIIGFLYTKDFVHWLTGPEAARPGAFRLDRLLRPAVYVPETKTADELLKDLIAHRVHIAVATDEYGGTAGVVTLEDIVEEVFGEIGDEYAQDKERSQTSVHRESSSAELDARTRIDEANDVLGEIGVSLPESDDYETLGGLVVVRLGFIPEAGATVEVDGARLTVLNAEPTRVTRVKVERMAPREDDEEDAAEDEEPAIDAETVDRPGK